MVVFLLCYERDWLVRKSLDSNLETRTSTNHAYRGFDVQVNGAMISIPQFDRTLVISTKGQLVLPARWLSAFNTISSVGQFFGGFMCCFIANLFGRRAAMLVGIMLVGSGIFGEVLAT